MSDAVKVTEVIPFDIPYKQTEGKYFMDVVIGGQRMLISEGTAAGLLVAIPRFLADAAYNRGNAA